jgi:replication-associated recombination protein RarA
MAVHHTKDPWTRIRSPRGLFADELISAFQKYIRRGKLEDALLVAREMCETSSELEEKMWERILVISVEDVGSGTFIEPLIVESLYRLHARFPEGAGERWLFATDAVRYLATSSKDRTSDELAMWTVHMLQCGERRVVIPDYALDVHTRQGQEMGRSSLHFLTESSRIENELPGGDDKYRKQMIAAVSRMENGGNSS